MKLLSDWGFSRSGWRQGTRGEYWVVAQGLLMVGFVLLPGYRLQGMVPLSDVLRYGAWGVAAVLAIVALLFFMRGLGELGQSLTPLPYPRDDGALVQSGIYGYVRHPIYAGVIFAALAWTIALVSLSHLIGTLVFVLFFNAKATREEIWLVERYPLYSEYQQRVKKLIPWIY